MRGLFVLFMGVAAAAPAACSSFESLPTSDAGALPAEDAAVVAADPPDAGPIVDAAPSLDAGAVVVYRNDFATNAGVARTRADLAQVGGRDGGVGLRMCGTGGNTSGGVFGADMGKLLGTPGVGRYVVRVWTRHDTTTGLPTLAVALTTGTYDNVTDSTVTVRTMGAPLSLSGTWIELVEDVLITEPGQYPAAAILATPQSGTATGCFRIDDLTLERRAD